MGVFASEGDTLVSHRTQMPREPGILQCFGRKYKQTNLRVKTGHFPAPTFL